MSQDKKLNRTNRSGSSSLHLFALMKATRSGPVKFRRKKMKFKWISYAIVSMAIYVAWSMFFIISQFNATIFMSVFQKMAKVIIGY